MIEVNLADPYLNDYERKEIGRLLNSIDPNKDDLENMWRLLDIIWDEFGCDNEKLNMDKINKFYSHPVWLLNGLFIEQHDISMSHRLHITKWIIEKKFKTIIDYGGGFGTLAKLISDRNPNINIDIFEPFPSEYALKRLKKYKNISFIDEIKKQYDCLIATDVLEHVKDPLKIFSEMVKSVKIGGYLIIANNFEPVIKCHLPSTFHLKYTFDLFAQLMGLKVIGDLKGSHAKIYQKIKEVELNWEEIRYIEQLSKKLYSLLENYKFGVDTNIFKKIDKNICRQVWNFPVDKKLILFVVSRKEDINLIDTILSDYNIVIYNISDNYLEFSDIKVIDTLKDNISLITLLNATDLIIFIDYLDNIHLLIKALSCETPVIILRKNNNSSYNFFSHKFDCFILNEITKFNIKNAIEWCFNNNTLLIQNSKIKIYKYFNLNKIKEKINLIEDEIINFVKFNF